MKRLPHARAFVIQLRAPGEDGSEHFAGRAEHIATGATATFDDVDELPGLLLTMLRNAGLFKRRPGDPHEV